MAKSQNAINLAAFNAAFERLTLVSHNVPFVGGCAARFYSDPVGGGWQVVEKFGASGRGETIVKKIDKTTVDTADSVKFDPYNDAAAAIAYLRLAGVNV